VHRDVKPDNVIVGDDGVVKLLDFGIARRLPGPIDPAAATARDGTITVEGTLVGTPAYMAPEQLRGEKVDGRADQFAWAVMAFELLARTKPWATTNAAELIAAVLSKPAPPLVVAGVPAHVTATIARALAKPPGDRFSSMDALVAALDGDGASVRARPRLPLFWLVGGVAALAAVAVVVGAVRRHASDAPPTPPPGKRAPVSSAGGVAPVRYFCDRDKTEGCPLDGERAWCDRDGNFLGCCAEGMVALGHDGMCGCPKGGSTRDGTSCERSLHTTSDYGRSYLFGASRRAVSRACGEIADRVGYDLVIDPDGRVFRASLHGGPFASEAQQRCVLDALRKLEVDPPPNGEMGIGYGPVYSIEPKPH